jgi:catechol 2,3-dioxygenase-like lactoylglutathione lyase family enzyme
MDHISIVISDTTATRAFYEACLAPLGWHLRGARPGRYVGFHKAGCAVLYFAKKPNAVGGVHLAFIAENEEAVRAFFDAALEHGGKDNGPPGPRPDYGADYYAAFVLDPDGHNVEAVVGGVHRAAEDRSES